jgi:hypothetical protein
MLLSLPLLTITTSMDMIATIMVIIIILCIHPSLTTRQEQFSAMKTLMVVL